MGRLRYFLLATDLGFLGYWLVTLLHLFPAAWLFQDYTNPLLVAWNWSFLPLDLLVSATGLTALMRASRGLAWQKWALLSLTLTSSSGLNAIAFWFIRRDFDVGWWAPNVFLLVWPLFFLPRLLSTKEP